jgi:RNA polymerase sigma-70 factor (ECF subfamily)
MTERSDKSNKQGTLSGAPLSDADFHKALTDAIPHLRAFARTLCGNRDRADDLAQETLMKAWAARERYVAGTSFRAWTFTILRHHYFGQLRRERFVGEYDEGLAETILNTPGDQEGRLEATDVLRALQTLPDAQREVLILMAVGSVSYEEIAEICGVAVGTVKSRIARARAALTAVLEGGILPDIRHNFVQEGEVLEAFITQFRQIAPAHMTLRLAA